MAKKFIIFGHARSGSSTLFRIMNSHPNLSVVTEPFNENRSNWKIPGKKYYPSEKGLEELWSEFDGLKHLVGQASVEENKRLLLSADVVITLRRRNLLKTALSHHISQQTNHWNTDRELIRSFSFDPINIKVFKKILERKRSLFDQYDKHISDNNIKHLSVTYENFYHQPAEAKLNSVQSLYDFVEVSPYRGDDVIRLLDPRNTKLNSMDTYKLIPNFDEIAALGSDKYGYL